MALFAAPFNKEKSLKAAETFIRSGKLDAAIDEYRKILENEPGNTKTIHSLADLYVRAERTREAVPLFFKLAESYQRAGHGPQAVAMYRRVLKMDINNYAAAITLAEIGRDSGNAEEAVQYYLSAANAAKRTNQLPTAIKAAQEALNLDPKSSRARAEMAALLFLSGDADQSHDLYVQAGREFLQNGKQAEGVEAFRRALAAKPGSKPALRALTECLVRQGEVRGAVKMVQQLIASNQDDTDLLILLGRTCLSGDLLDDAEKAFSRLVELDPTRFDYLLETAKSAVHRALYPRAVRMVEHCLDAVLARGQKKKATAVLKNVIQLDPTQLPALKLLADIYRRVEEKRNLTNTLNATVEIANRLGDRERAMEALKELVSIAPRKKSYQQQLARMEGANEEAGGDEDDDELDQYNYSTQLLESMVSQNPMFVQARLKMLEDMAAGQPDSIEIRTQLKQFYLEGKLTEKAALTTLEIGRLSLARGWESEAEHAFAEAVKLDPSLLSTVQVLSSPATPSPEAGAVGTNLSAAMTGRVTGTMSRIPTPREFHQYFEIVWRHPLFSIRPLALLKIRVDNLSADFVVTDDVRDTYLNPVVEALLEELSGPDAKLTYAGQAVYFALIPDANPDMAEAVAERMRLKIESLWLPHPDPDNLEWMTVSVSAATALPKAVQPGAMIAAVNHALDQAQQQGGNRVVALHG